MWAPLKYSQSQEASQHCSNKPLISGLKVSAPKVPKIILDFGVKSLWENIPRNTFLKPPIICLFKKCSRKLLTYWPKIYELRVEDYPKKNFPKHLLNSFLKNLRSSKQRFNRKYSRKIALKKSFGFSGSKVLHEKFLKKIKIFSPKSSGKKYSQKILALEPLFAKKIFLKIFSLKARNLSINFRIEGPQKMFLNKSLTLGFVIYPKMLIKIHRVNGLSKLSLKTWIWSS